MRIHGTVGGNALLRDTSFLDALGQVTTMIATDATNCQLSWFGSLIALHRWTDH